MFFDIPSSDDKFRSVSRMSFVNQVFDNVFATTLDLFIDLPRLPSSSVKKVLLRIANATFKTLMVVCILSDIIRKSSYASVYEFYSVIRKALSLQCISRRRLTSCLISRNSSKTRYQNNIYGFRIQYVQTVFCIIFFSIFRKMKKLQQ